MTPNRSTSRRAAARRFSLPFEPVWERVQRALLAAGLAAAGWGAARALGMGDLPDAGALAALALTGLAAFAAASWPLRAREAAVLRWDGAQWWWQRAGEPIAISPDVFIDVEQWMLLRLRPRRDPAPFKRGARRPRTIWVAVSRRALGASWTPLRQHLFLAREARPVSGEIRA